ncbi:bifunctional phosphopantothenoylcysteine decarboxylase/phosphopantothenate--cysteine ligase CoaBC [Dethiothermospora halolimnae]|uniref:bifunctional phosphopantothenoylcysteine decarboxylase/phosphopantothenate--cysteine ligase CoaBC n=1 Tax=Dethiothermospora halolimnae TaxID=3114390 RepID=UPI003CCC2FC1
MLKGKNIVMGITGGIAAYKAVDIVSRLRKKSANINVVMTNSAAKFVTPLTFQSLSQNYVTVDMFEEPKTWDVEHISLAQKADLFLVAPATANVIGKVANGIADDMLTTTIMATKAKVVFAPAMNTNMYTNPIFKENVKKLKKLGYEFIKPASGRLACGDYGEGKMAQPEDIADYVTKSLISNELEGRKILVTAGPTIEAIDPVRYITNRSSGKMGYAIAEEAKNKGAEVILVSGPTNLEKPSGVKVIDVTTTEEMLMVIKDNLEESDVLIKAAAPLDYKPKEFSKSKIKKNDGNMELEFVRNSDILFEIGKNKGDKILVGFAAETDNIIENAKNKIKKKNLDFIVANDISKKDVGFISNHNMATIINRKGDIDNYPKMTKSELAKVIINKVQSHLK